MNELSCYTIKYVLVSGEHNRVSNLYYIFTESSAFSQISCSTSSSEEGGVGLGLEKDEKRVQKWMTYFKSIRFSCQ